MASTWQGDLFKHGRRVPSQGRLAFRPVNSASRRNREARSLATWLLPVAALAVVLSLGLVAVRIHLTEVGYRLATMSDVIQQLEHERRELAQAVAVAEATEALEKAGRDLGMVPPTLAMEVPLR